MTTLIILSILGFLFLVLIGWVIGGYNVFVAGRQNIKTQWSNIKTEYQRRADLLYNLVEAVKSHKKFEKETLIEVVKARKGNFGNSKQSEVKSMKKMDNAFSKLFSGLNIVFERYPELKSSEQHNKLMEEIRVTEDRVQIARTDYNDIIRRYNLSVKLFPSSILANTFKFVVEEYFKNDEESEGQVKINLTE